MDLREFIERADEHEEIEHVKVQSSRKHGRLTLVGTTYVPKEDLATVGDLRKYVHTCIQQGITYALNQIEETGDYDRTGYEVDTFHVPVVVWLRI